MGNFSNWLKFVEEQQQGIVDPETGETFTENPFLNDDGTYTDPTKAQQWEARKRVAIRKIQQARTAKSQEFANNHVKNDDGNYVNKMDAAWDSFSKLFQKYFDAFVANNITDPFNAHPGFRKLVFDNIFKKYNLSNQEAQQLLQWHYKGRPSAFGNSNNFAYLQHAIKQKAI